MKVDRTVRLTAWKAGAGMTTLNFQEFGIVPNLSIAIVGELTEDIEGVSEVELHVEPLRELVYEDSAEGIGSFTRLRPGLRGRIIFPNDVFAAALQLLNGSGAVELDLTFQIPRQRHGWITSACFRSNSRPA